MAEPEPEQPQLRKRLKETALWIVVIMVLLLAAFASSAIMFPG